MRTQPLETRVEALEREIVELKRSLELAPPGDWRRSVGLFRGDAAFGEIVRAGAAIRAAERPSE